MSYKTTGTLNGDFHIPGLLDFFEQYFENEVLETVLDTWDFELEDFYLLSNISCIKGTFENKTIEILVYFIVFIKDDVPRLQIEKNMLEFTNSSMRIKMPVSFFNWLFINFTNEYNRRATYVPNFIHKSYYQSSCYRHFGHNGDYSWLSKGDENPDMLYKSVHVAPLLICPQVIFKKHEFRIDWDGSTIHIIHIHHKFYFDEFKISNDGYAVVCLEQVKDLLTKYSITSSIMTGSISVFEILTLVCLIASILCLLLTLITYILLASLRTAPGKNNICLAMSLLLAQALMLVQPNVHRIDELCSVVGSISHFSWLSYFSWTGICTFHMFRVFGFGAVASGVGSNKTVLKYCLVAFGIPLLVVVSSLSVSLALSGGKTSGYETYRCFIANKINFIATMIAPLGCICLLNIILFTITACRLRNMPKVQKSKEDTINFRVYVKLFSLTGITWTVQIVDSFLIMSPLSYISTILNGTQGVYIFFCYVCNRRTLDLYRKFFSPGDRVSAIEVRRKNIQTSRL